MLKEGNPEWSGGSGRWCQACKRPIEQDQPIIQLYFRSDPHGFEGQTGEYHRDCGRPFASIARVLDVLSRYGS